MTAGDERYDAATVALVAEATEKHHILHDRTDAMGNNPCVCGQWWDAAGDNPGWDEHMAAVALTALADAELLRPPDDPTPTTGGPVDFERAEGCRCYLREDPEYGDLLTAPPGGCPVHSCNCLTFVYHGTHSSMCINTTLNTLRPGSP